MTFDTSVFFENLQQKFKLHENPNIRMSTFNAEQRILTTSR